MVSLLSPAPFPHAFSAADSVCADSVTYVVRILAWSNDTYFNNFHSHNGEPPMSDIACNTFVFPPVLCVCSLCWLFLCVCVCVCVCVECAFSPAGTT